MIKKRIFIECTQTYFRGGNSGIQRVVRNVANHALNLTHPKCEVIPIIWAGYGFTKIPTKLTGREHFLIRFRTWIQRKREKRTRLPFIASIVRAIRFVLGPVKAFLPLRTFYVIACWTKQKITILIASLGYQFARFLFGRAIHFRKGDTVLLIDSTWSLPGMLDALFHAQKVHGIKVAPMLHDLFPLTLPETCEEITIKYYRLWFYKIVPAADFFITNSKSTGHSLERFLEANPGIRSLPVLHESFRLGAELDLIKKSDKDRKLLNPIFAAPGRAILSIGTIEPRKNHEFLLDAFDSLLAQGADVTLFIVGRIGWKSEAVVKRIQNHPELNTRLFHFDNASDSVLAGALDRAECIVCASIAEGFGLPVVEGLMRGKVVFASDIEVFREIASDRCRFFNLEDPSDLTSQLLHWFESKERSAYAGPAEGFRWLTWRESCEELIDKTIKTLRRLRQDESRNAKE